MGKAEEWPAGPGAANHLNRLLQKKHKAEYDPQPVSQSDATAAVKQAEKLVAIARRVVSESLPPTN
jgi:stage V sporulation protein SpoVS